MKAVFFEKPGPPDVLKIINTKKPLFKDNEILIKVVAAGVNRPDVIQREGNYPAPDGHSKILGLEVSGIVDKIGKNVTKFSEGDKVAALVNGGGYAEYCVASESVCFDIPKFMSFNDAACIPECFFTAWSNLVYRGEINKKYKKVLIHGGTSGIGIAAIQIAKLFDSQVFTTVGNDEKGTFCKKIGVDMAINYKKEDYFDVIKKLDINGLDLVLDFIGGDYIKKNINLLSKEGKLINIGFQKGSKVELNLIKIMLNRLTVTGSTLRIRDDDYKSMILQDIKKYIFPQIQKGKIKIFVDSVFKLDDVVNAHKRLDEGNHIGKVVLNS